VEGHGGVEPLRAVILLDRWRLRVMENHAALLVSCGRWKFSCMVCMTSTRRPSNRRLTSS
jgi:hypothetical protein